MGHEGAPKSPEEETKEVLEERERKGLKDIQTRKGLLGMLELRESGTALDALRNQIMHALNVGLENEDEVLAELPEMYQEVVKRVRENEAGEE